MNSSIEGRVQSILATMFFLRDSLQELTNIRFPFSLFCGSYTLQGLFWRFSKVVSISDIHNIAPKIVLISCLLKYIKIFNFVEIAGSYSLSRQIIPKQNDCQFKSRFMSLAFTTDQIFFKLFGCLMWSILDKEKPELIDQIKQGFYLPASSFLNFNWAISTSTGNTDGPFNQNSSPPVWT